ncbi:37S ribosomal protein S9, mitochondrial [Microsporum canis]|uniref:Small ribosomal subunit protein uS9m n=1 Tax=Arthroderma otae (strain ATCC MYA-4605 / CBS 113480) TaxID=554155 RepID=C5FRS4_ARTOC|nr:mitochondrial 37S ribosomal protein MRPS9 [Microsporum canis CBS 113480]EEQ32577.1 40S ribosomal protein S9 [Microsporum canis CBS 113480]
MAWQRPVFAARAFRFPRCLMQPEAARHQPFSTVAPAPSDGTSDAAPPMNLDEITRLPTRMLPASPSYFTGSPKFTDYELKLQHLRAKYVDLPSYGPREAPRIAWLVRTQFLSKINEDISVSRYARLLKSLKVLNKIKEDVMPQEVSDFIAEFSRPRNLYQWELAPKKPDENGRARGMGRRKTAHATAYLVEGDGQIMVNGKAISEVFPRIHDRESAMWALKATNRLHKYNVFAVARGGGVTGQAEAVTLAVAKALLVHEPGLKSALRRAGVIRTDPRQVERKKPGKLKARKMPAWVKR